MSNSETEQDPFAQKMEFEQPCKPTGNAGTMRTMRTDTARQIKELFDKCADPIEKTRLGELLEKLTKQHRPLKRQPRSMFQ